MKHSRQVRFKFVQPIGMRNVFGQRRNPQNMLKTFRLDHAAHPFKPELNGVRTRKISFGKVAVHG
jgi:hypothetical protein